MVLLLVELLNQIQTNMKKYLIILLILFIDCKPRQILPCSFIIKDLKNRFGTKQIDSVYLLRSRVNDNICREFLSASEYIGIVGKRDTIIIFNICQHPEFEINKKYKFIPQPIDSLYTIRSLNFPCGADFKKYPIYFGTLK